MSKRDKELELIQGLRVMKEYESQEVDIKFLDEAMVTATKALTLMANDKRMKLPKEFGDVQYVIDNGAIKYGRDSWLEPGVFTFAKRSQSEFRHLMKKTGLYYTDDGEVAKAIDIIMLELGVVTFEEKNRLDKESGFSHDLHSACNALMFHTVKERGILKPGDK